MWKTPPEGQRTFPRSFDTYVNSKLQKQTPLLQRQTALCTGMGGSVWPPCSLGFAEKEKKKQQNHKKEVDLLAFFGYNTLA